VYREYGTAPVAENVPCRLCCSVVDLHDGVQIIRRVKHPADRVTNCTGPAVCWFLTRLVQSALASHAHYTARLHAASCSVSRARVSLPIQCICRRFRCLGLITLLSEVISRVALQRDMSLCLTN
jgi:hypothetical protein